MVETMAKYREIRLITEEPEDSFLNEKQLLDYKYHQIQLIDWFLDEGKDPENGEGYSKNTVEPAMYRIDRFYRFIWRTSGHTYTTLLDHDDAADYLRYIALQDYENSYKKGIEKAVKMLFKWNHHIRDLPKWDCKFSFQVPASEPPAEYLTEMELVKLREAAREHGSIPSYSNLSPLDRDRWKSYLADRFEIPKSEVDKSDWERAHSWKFPSLVWTAIDAGLRPNEVEQASVEWLDLENNVLQIPKDDESDEEWIVSIRKETSRALEQWLKERRHYEKYDETDLLWLTRRENPYQSNSLNYLLKKLCETAGIDVAGRKITWFTLRDSVGKHMAEVGDIELIQEQLRHESRHTERRYDAGVEKRRKMLDRI